MDTLPYHALDVAAIGERLLHRRADWTRRIADHSVTRRLGEGSAG